MDVVRDWREVPARLRGAIVALGNFDGVHLGHREVIGLTRERAAGEQVPAGVISFHPHPRRFFSPDKPFFRLTPQPLKLRLLDALGVDVVFVVSFDAALAALTPRQFVDDVLVGGLRVRHAIAGWNFRFGAKRAGDTAMLEQLAGEHGVGVTVIRPQSDGGGETYSSSRVRALLAAGEPRAAAEILGYHWRLVETVVGGEGRGAGLGFPTINMRLDPGVALAHGIYAVRVTACGNTYDGAAYFGTRPTFAGTEAFLETFMFDFEGNLYGREVEVEFVDYLRGDRTFDDAQALSEQIARDCERARAVLADVRESDRFSLPLPGPAGTT